MNNLSIHYLSYLFIKYHISIIIYLSIYSLYPIIYLSFIRISITCRSHEQNGRSGPSALDCNSRSFAKPVSSVWAQGQSLQKVGLYLTKPIFSHGQLYVALSRVRNIDGLKIVLADTTDAQTTTNVVYKEVFTNISSHCR